MPADYDASLSYWQFIGAADATIIFVPDIDPVLGALGSAGAHATIGPPPGFTLLHGTTKG